MDRNDELTIGARSKGWEIFSPQWDYLAEIPALELGSICAMSVGLHPYFASPAWVLLVAMPHFDGTDSDEWYPLEDAKKGAERAKRLKEFLKRAHVACANLAPLGHLPIAAGEPNSEKTVVRVADFAVWAASRGWELPAEFPKPEPVLARADAEPVPEEARQAEAGVSTDGLVGWQAVMLESWQEIAKAYDGTPSPRNAMHWLRKHGSRDVFPEQQPDHHALAWLDLAGNPQTVTLKTIQNQVSLWKADGKIPV